MRKRRRSAFTLIELLVVMAIIGILAGFVVAALKSMKRQAKVTRAASEVKQIRDAWSMYVVDYKHFVCGEMTEMDVEAVQTMTGNNTTNNPKKKSYMDFKDSTQWFCDPWGDKDTGQGAYRLVFDTDLDGKVAHPDTGEIVPVHVIVWSCGEDGVSGTQDDVNSWSQR
ncbi:type II secretion system protein [Verrucomicrobiota bacterium]